MSERRWNACFFLAIMVAVAVALFVNTLTGNNFATGVSFVATGFCLSFFLVAADSVVSAIKEKKS